MPTTFRLIINLLDSIITHYKTLENDAIYTTKKTFLHLCQYSNSSLMTSSLNSITRRLLI